MVFVNGFVLKDNPNLNENNERIIIIGVGMFGLSLRKSLYKIDLNVFEGLESRHLNNLIMNLLLNGLKLHILFFNSCLNFFQSLSESLFLSAQAKNFSIDAI